MLNATTNNNASNLDFYQYAKVESIDAYTLSFKKNSNGVYEAMTVYRKDLENWTYAEVHINDTNMAPYSAAKRNTIIAHEILHGLGLKDLYNSSNSHLLMYGYSNSIPTSGKNMSALENSIIDTKY